MSVWLTLRDRGWILPETFRGFVDCACVSGEAGNAGSLGAAIISSCEPCSTGAGTSLVLLRSYVCALTTEPALTTVVFLFVCCFEACSLPKPEACEFG